ncbi:tripartite tricarboxylate transporter substrate binding protein [Pigmentiphaga soli]|uniref:Tripartite tricarboxylate transporter substrate binding protein n=1 Tax=Pigmentiphaga soli TaxID=1007095 RepID=A0ABP8GD11_9BURK
MRKLVQQLLLIASAALPQAVPAQDFPSKPIRLLVGFTPGGATDLITRTLAQGLTEVMGQPIVVENIPGASATLATRKVAEAEPDGYTLLMMTSNDPVQSALHPGLPYKLETDITPISQVAIGAYILTTNPSVKAGNIAELIAFARAHPGKLTYASPGVGSAQHLAGELFKSMAKVDILHIPYKGGGEVMNALAAGQVDMTFGALPPSLPFIRANKVKALAVTTEHPISSLPGVPTLNDSGLAGYDRAGWFALTAPKGLPRDLALKINHAVAQALRMQTVKDALGRQGLEPQPSTPEQLAAFIRRELKQASTLIELAGVKID